MLVKEAKLAANQGIELEVNRNARDWLLAQNDQPEFGARPLRRIIARHLRNPLADFLLDQRNRSNAKVLVDAKDGELIFKFEEGKSEKEKGL